MSSTVHWHCLVQGRVQGVGYRARVLEAAELRGLAGRVANRPDGTVFIDVQGPSDGVEAFLRDVSGPRGLSNARAIRRLAELPVRAELTGFEVSRD